MSRERLTQARMHKRANAVLRIDPRRRCIALLVYESKLIIIPIRYCAEGDIDDDLAPVCKSVYNTCEKKTALAKARHVLLHVRAAHVRAGLQVSVNHCVSSHTQDEILQPNKKFKGEKAAQGVMRLGCAPSDHTQLGFLPSYVIDLDEAADLHGAKGIRFVCVKVLSACNCALGVNFWADGDLGYRV